MKVLARSKGTAALLWLLASGTFACGGGDASTASSSGGAGGSGVSSTSSSTSGSASTSSTSSASSTSSSSSGGGGGGGGAGVPCMNAADCPGQDTECQTRTCAGGFCGFDYKPLGTLTSMQMVMDCKLTECDGNGAAITVADDTDLPIDNNPCTYDFCMAGVPSNPKVPASTPCGGGLVCDGFGDCVECFMPADCPGQDTECTKRTCDPFFLTCGLSYTPAGTPVMSQMPGDCHENQCDGAGAIVNNVDNMDLPVDNNQCTTDMCVAGVPSNPPIAAGAPCNQNGGAVCDGGGACVPDFTVLILGGGATSMLGGELHQGAPWTTAQLAGVTVSGVSLAITTAKQGVGLMRFTKIGDPNDNLLLYTTWNAGSWAPFAVVSAGVTTQGAPAISAGNGTAQAAFHGFDFKYYYAALTGGAWSPVAEPAGSPQSFGPVAPAIAARGGDATLAFINGGDSNNAHARDRTGGAWAGGQLVAQTTNFNIPPAVAAMTGGPELMMAYVRNDAQVMFAIRAGGVWSAAAAVTGVTTDDPVSLAALPAGGAVLAYRGQDGKLYASFYAAAMWSPPAAVENPNVSIVSSPSVAHGVGGATAELAFIETDNVIYHVRYQSGVWTAPVAVGGSAMGHVAIASFP